MLTNQIVRLLINFLHMVRYCCHYSGLLNSSRVVFVSHLTVCDAWRGYEEGGGRKGEGMWGGFITSTHLLLPGLTFVYLGETVALVP